MNPYPLRGEGPSSGDCSPSSSSEESVNEGEPNTSSISRPSGLKRKRNDSQPRSKGESKIETIKKEFSLNNYEMEELFSWIFSAQEAAQVEA